MEGIFSRTWSIRAWLRGVRHGPLKEPAWLVGARVAVQVLGPAVTLLMVRYLGTYQYGLYAAAAAIATLVSVLCDFGLRQVAMKLGAAQAHLGTVLRRVILLGFGYSGVAVLVLVLWLQLGHYHPLTVLVGLIVAATYPRIPVISVVTAGLQLRGRYQEVAVWSLALSGAQWITTLAGIGLGLGLVPLVALPEIARYVVTGWMLVRTGRSLGLWAREPAAARLPGSRALVKESVLFGASSTMYQLYHRSDSAILASLRGPVEVAAYSVAFRIIELSYLLPGIVFNDVLFPKFFRWASNRRERLALYYRLTSKAMPHAGLVVGAAVGLFAGEAVQLVFGSPQPQAALFLRVMALAIPWRYWASAAGSVLMTAGEVATRLRVQVAVAVGNVAANLVLVPLAGGLGSAAVMGLTELALLAGYGQAVKRHMGLAVPRTARTLAEMVALLAGAAGLVVAAPLLGLGWRVAALAGVTALAVGAAGAGLGPEERREVRYLLGGSPGAPVPDRVEGVA